MAWHRRNPNQQPQAICRYCVSIFTSPRLGWYVEFEARIVAMTFVVNSSWATDTERMLQQKGNERTGTESLLLFLV